MDMPVVMDVSGPWQSRSGERHSGIICTGRDRKPGGWISGPLEGLHSDSKRAPGADPQAPPTIEGP